VLAGHSLGGLIALVYTVRHCERVAGLALIDSSHPDMHKRLPADEWSTGPPAKPPSTSPSST
jgi:pimeloyl-ACP methyl ester carboxylesterase